MRALALVCAVTLVGCSDRIEAPNAVAEWVNANEGIFPGGVAQLDGSASSDPDGGQLSFSWSVPSGTFVEGTSSTSEIAKVTFPGAAPYKITLTVTDSDGNSDSFSFTVGLS